MKTSITALLLLILAASQALAQPKPTDHSAPRQASAAAASADMAAGEVRKVDKAANKLTLKHGEIKNLDMPPMTMVFRVKDVRQIAKLAPGDKVLFSAEKLDGNYVVTQIRAAP